MKNRDYILFLGAIIAAGLAQGLMDASFNNFLNSTFVLSSTGRTLLEVPRELPGFLTVFVSALLFFFCTRRLAAFSQALAAVGMGCIALFVHGKTDYHQMLGFLFVYSMGQHLFMPLFSDIGMNLAKQGAHGRALGNFQAGQNLASMAGFLAVFACFKFFKVTFSALFFVSMIIFLIAALLLYNMKRDTPAPLKDRLLLRKEYGMFYWLSILFGTRKQIFLTFAPWVLVAVFKRPVQDVALLLFVGGALGIVVKPLLGRAIDKFGEKPIMVGEGLLLVIVCLLYGFAPRLFPEGQFGSLAVTVICGCFIADNLLMAASMARSTYLKKIALKPADVSPTLAMGVSIDHIFSISIALIGGLVWTRAGASGYEWVFLGGAVIALAQFVTALQLRVRTYV